MNAYTCIDNTMPTGEEDQFNHALAAVTKAVESLPKMHFFDFYYAMVLTALRACKSNELNFAEDAFYECAHQCGMDFSE